ncbi:MFS transporter [Aquabacterium sp.]|uniref:MFS transporter n=1 Tax=Aquabacterium sp. TaxID=1872578 RepID=UPI002B717924|nr:MFS transporter [Aquabacterium sp.]HSW05852.1 MFS transporter [Aquabacterium sp.]
MTGAEHRGTQWALLYGNFTIGCGVMVTAGALNDLVRSLQVSVAVGGQLIAVAAVVMAVGAPLMAAVVAGIDRRRLLTWSLVWFGAGHALSALMPNYAALLPVRALSVLGAAVFTPQAAAAIGVMVPVERRGRAITFVFLGWSVSSVLGMPLHAYIGESIGWRYAFALVALLSLAGALWVWRAMPDGVRPAALSGAHWRQVFTHPVLMATVAVTALSAAGQFTLFSYFAPYYHQVLGASAAEISLMFLWFGAVGVIGNVLLSRYIDRIGADRAVTGLLACMALTLLVWPLGTSLPLMVLVIAPWALGCFSSNSAQQARLSLAAPALASALVALNSSAMYVGQALGATSGGAMVAQVGFGPLHWVGLVWMLLALALSQWAARRVARDKLLAPAHG